MKTLFYLTLGAIYYATGIFLLSFVIAGILWGLISIGS
jgi:hypothetical protein